MTQPTELEHHLRLEVRDLRALLKECLAVLQTTEIEDPDEDYDMDKMLTDLRSRVERKLGVERAF